MAPVKSSPLKLYGPWTEGYVLDRHTVSSVPTGDPFHPFETKRTELGELLYQLKYGNRPDAAAPIVDTAEDFIRNGWRGLPPLDCVVPAPPSVTARPTQPVVELARALAARLGIRTCEDAVVKAGPTQQMKNIEDWAERRRALGDAIKKGAGDVKNKRVLVFDDLTESGSTLGRVAEILLKEGSASQVYALVLTRTK
jgi:competence protein ComFC